VPDDLEVAVWLFRSLIRAMNLKFWKRLDEKKKLRRTSWPKRTDIERRKWLKNLIMNWKLSICWQQAVKLKSGGGVNWKWENYTNISANWQLGVQNPALRLRPSVASNCEYNTENANWRTENEVWRAEMNDF